MSTWQTISKKLLKAPIACLVKTNSIPCDPIAELEIDLKQPIVYVLPFFSLSDLLTLRKNCKKHQLPDPLIPQVIHGKNIPSYIFVSQGNRVFDVKDTVPEDSIAAFGELLELHKQDPNLAIQLVPVSVVWNRNPGHESRPALPPLQAMNGLQKCWTILSLGRDSLVRFSRAVSVRKMADEHGTDSAIAIKLARVAKIHFSRQKMAASGPQLPNRQALFHRLLQSKAIEKVVQEEAKSRQVPEEKVRKEAIEMLEEIAADFSPDLIRFSDTLLTWLWNKLYQGITIHNAEKIRQLAQDGHEIVYVPCHRSHMDYVLLSYVLYKQGLVPPHIAAGVNLNFFPAGPIFRRGGAFFLRRTFKGNHLYSTVFREYLAELFAKGYSVEYFSEGGRSRTGRLLCAKTGMLAMTIQAMLRGLKRPVTLVPVYIGYEHVMEVNTYAKELQGQRKEKENFGQVLGILRKLRNYGKGYVNFGEPIPINQFLNQSVPHWKESINPLEPQRPSWLIPTVNQLADTMMTHINDAAAVNALNLCAMVLLASRQRALSREMLESQLESCLALLKHVPYSAQSTLPEGDAQTLVTHAIGLNKFVVEKDALGEVISLDRQQAVLLTYYRNNIIHLYVLPSLIALILLSRVTSNRDEIIATVQKLYPLLKAELYMGICEQDLEDHCDAILAELARQDLILNEADQWQRNLQKLTQLQLLARIISETLQRYAITLTVISHAPNLNKSAWEKQSQTMAQRLSRLHGINAPEFFDKAVFTTLFNSLKGQGYFEEDGCANVTRVAPFQDLLINLLTPDVQLTIETIFSQDQQESPKE